MYNKKQEKATSYLTLQRDSKTPAHNFERKYIIYLYNEAMMFKFRKTYPPTVTFNKNQH